jgi:hypothetical protein
MIFILRESSSRYSSLELPKLHSLGLDFLRDTKNYRTISVFRRKREKLFCSVLRVAFQEMILLMNSVSELL